MVTQLFKLEQYFGIGDDKPFHNNIITLKGCSNFDVGDTPCEIISRNNEINVLVEWKNLIEKYDPDIITDITFLVLTKHLCMID